MSDFREQYLDWVLGGRKAPRPAVNNPMSRPAVAPGAPTLPGAEPPSGALPVPMDYGNVPVTPNRQMIAPAAAPPSGVVRGISPWEMLGSVPAGLSELAPSIAGAAGGAALAHLVNPPSLNEGEDALLEQLLKSKPLETVHVKGLPSGGTPVDAIPATTPQKSKGYATATKAIPAAQDAKSATANGVSTFEGRVGSRLKERAAAAKDVSKNIGSIDDLRVLSREMQRKKLQQEGGY